MADIFNLLNKKSGMLGISGLSNDMRDIEKAASEGNRRAELALKMFALRVKKYIGAYLAEMNGLTLLSFQPASVKTLPWSGRWSARDWKPRHRAG